jgi:hypothetical protein
VIYFPYSVSKGWRVFSVSSISATAGSSDSTRSGEHPALVGCDPNLRFVRSNSRLAMKKVLLICLALSLLFFLVSFVSAADTTTVKGYVSDSQCGVKGASESHAGCMTKCIAKGAKYVIVTDDKKVLNVDNGDALKGHEGHHITATGKVTGDTIHVDSVSM